MKCPICDNDFKVKQKNINYYICLNKSHAHIEVYFFDKFMHCDESLVFEIGKYSISLKNNTTFIELLDEKRHVESTIIIDYRLPIDKFDSLEKIKKLLSLV